MYFDGTFSCVPHPFYQCIIVMIFAEREQKYIPCIWILLTGKTKKCYSEAISWVSRCLPNGRRPCVRFAGVDFEPAFFNAISICFPEAIIIGCFFHFKQAIRAKLKKLGMHKAVVSVIMLIMNYAPSIPPSEMLEKGIPYLKTLVRAALKKQRDLNKIDNNMWKSFWAYFEE